MTIYQFYSLQRMDWHFRTNGTCRRLFTGSHSAAFSGQYVPEDRTSEPTRFNQQELYDLIRDLSLTKDKTELLVSRLKEKRLFRELCQSLPLQNKE
jgi:hypothetical protein